MVYVFKGGEGYDSHPLSIYPNPFSDFVTFFINIRGEISVKIYDKKGSLVKDLFRGNSIGEGFSLTWNGRDINGRKIPSGVYFVVLEGEGEVITSEKVVYFKRR
jgi:flagellar hook assembly protein FlgD